MKPLILTLLLTPLFLFADAKMEIYKLYQDKNYETACHLAQSAFPEYTKDEEFLSIYAFSCLNIDEIDQLSFAITGLKKSKESRANAAYFSVILMQKTLLMHALSDKYDLEPMHFPTSVYVLSTVYDLYAKDTGSKKRRRYNYIDPTDAKKSYRLFITKTGVSPKMVIEEYYDKILSQRHIYW